MAARKNVSPLALLVAVLTALAVGVLGSLAIRPPGVASESQNSTGGTGFEIVRWRATSSFTSNLPIIGQPPHRVADNLARMSGGAFQMQVFEPGEIVPALEITESVKEGKVQAGFQWVGYDQGRIPASTLISAVPFGMEPIEFSAWWYYGGGRELGEALYAPHNVMPILCGLTVPETAGWFRGPVESLDDLLGMKIRFAGLGGKVLQRLGASVTMIPAGEIFQALEKGAIDATEFSMPAVDQLLGFSRVAKYNYFPGWHQTFSAAHLQINLDEWNSLRNQTKTMIRVACRAAAMEVISEAEYLQGAVIQDFEQQGVVTDMLSTEILEQLRAVTREVLDEEAAKDEHFAKILKSQREFSEVYRYWKTRGYLPRSF
ncbi:MAG: TRAP transporter substrate-binding protein [Xanthomonadales bacterium]|nr:TRAP transporter substrate-binding protein [Gammaproteobacteria bacterium]NND58225.1 TRAP transporter substrate-binding protein [Xanthomonadales bacterium]NNK50066.1 TRAP transporter substrate-binding protein [Xanthomonadales bacterium]